MKKTVFILLPILVVCLFSCNSKKGNEEGFVVESKEVVEEDERRLESDITSQDEFEEGKISIIEGHVSIGNPFQKIAGNYTALSSEEGGDPIIYHYCEAEDPSVIIDEYEGQRRFIIALGQDSEVYEIDSIKGESYEMELYQVSDYKITLVNIYNDETVTVTALINEDTGTSFFEGLGSLQEMYLREDHINDVEHVSEECDYLNDY